MQTEYGMPQRRRRTYIVGYREGSNVFRKIENLQKWVLFDGVLAKAFPFYRKDKTESEFEIEGSIKEVSDSFNVGKKESPFGDAGIICRRRVYSVDTKPIYAYPFMTLGGNIVSEELVPQDFLSMMKNCLNGDMKRVQKK